MRGGEQRDRQPEHDLRHLPGRQAPGAANDQLPQREADVERERAVEQRSCPARSARSRARTACTLLHGLDRDEAERVVEEMRQREREKNEPGDEPPGLRVAQARAAQRGRVEPGGAAMATGIDPPGSAARSAAPRAARSCARAAWPARASPRATSAGTASGAPGTPACRCAAPSSAPPRRSSPSAGLSDRMPISPTSAFWPSSATLISPPGESRSHVGLPSQDRRRRRRRRRPARRTSARRRTCTRSLVKASSFRRAGSMSRNIGTCRSD